MAGELVPVADLAAPAVAAEIDSLKDLMRSGSPRYWRDESAQSRYRELIDARDGTGAPVDVDPGDQAFVSAELKPASLEEFTAAQPGYAYSDHLKVMREASDVVFAVPAGEQAGLIKTFNRLPDGAVAAIAAELANGFGTGFAYYPEDEVRKFAGEKGGRLVREWGNEAPVKMARVNARLHRCMDLMSEADEAAFLAWHDSLSDGQAAAIYRKLAA